MYKAYFHTLFPILLNGLVALESFYIKVDFNTIHSISAHVAVGLSRIKEFVI